MQVVASNFWAVGVMAAFAYIACGCGRNPVEELERRLTPETIETISAEARTIVREISSSKADSFPFWPHSIMTNDMARKNWAVAQGVTCCAVPFYAHLKVRNSDRETNVSNNLTCFDLTFWGVGEEHSWYDTGLVWIVMARRELSGTVIATVNTIRNIQRGIAYGWNGGDTAVHVTYKCISPFLGNEEASIRAYVQELQRGTSELYLLINDGYALGFRIGRKVYPANDFDSRMGRLVDAGYMCNMKVLMGNDDDLLFECIYEIGNQRGCNGLLAQ